MGMNRSGRSLPAGPAITAHASSGWSARAWATIFARSAGSSVSMDLRVAPLPLPQRVHQGLLQVGQPVVNPEISRTRVLRIQPRQSFLEVLGDRKAHAEREPDIIDGAQPGLRVVGGQPDLTAALRQRREHGAGRRDLAGSQVLLGVPAEIPRCLGVVAVGVRQQPGQHRIFGQGGRITQAQERGELLRAVPVAAQRIVLGPGPRAAGRNVPAGPLTARRNVTAGPLTARRNVTAGPLTARRNVTATGGQVITEQVNSRLGAAWLGAARLNAARLASVRQGPADW